MNLKVDVSEEDNTAVIRLTGELDVYTTPTLVEKLLPLTEIQGKFVQVNLDKTTYLDSTGLGVFISAYKSSQENGSSLQLTHVKGRVLRLFKVTGLEKIMDIETDEEDRGDRIDG